MKQVLIVEDILETQRWLAEIIRSAYPDATILMANSVRTALGKVNDAIELALIDLGLPDGSGLEVLRKLHTSNPSAVKVVTTVMGDDASIVASLCRSRWVSIERDRSRDSGPSVDTVVHGVACNFALCCAPHHGTFSFDWTNCQPGWTTNKA